MALLSVMPGGLVGVPMNERREALRQLLALPVSHAMLFGLVSSLSACQPAAPGSAPASSRIPLDHGFYIWQQVWRPAVKAALQAACSQVANWRVLALHVDGTSRLRPQIDVAALRDSQRPVHLVIRVEGSQAGVLDDDLIAQIQGLHAHWIKQGLPASGMEVDHDVAESQLHRYAAWLGRLRQAMPGTTLSITALPAWLHSEALSGLLAIPDEVVLQVHAVNKPAAGIFDAGSAQAWITTLAQRHPGPFRISLPCYGSRVLVDEWGQTLAIESEASVAMRSSHERELQASPSAVASLLSWLDVRAPPQMRGLMWFRLPTLEDQRSWRLGTWQALVSGVRSWGSVQARLVSTADASLWDVMLINSCELDQELPMHIVMPTGSRAFDGEQGYSADLLTTVPQLSRAKGGWLRAHQQLRVGWVRLEHVHPNELLDLHAT